MKKRLWWFLVIVLAVALILVYLDNRSLHETIDSLTESQHNITKTIKEPLAPTETGSNDFSSGSEESESATDVEISLSGLNTDALTDDTSTNEETTEITIE